MGEKNRILQVFFISGFPVPSQSLKDHILHAGRPWILFPNHCSLPRPWRGRTVCRFQILHLLDLETDPGILQQKGRTPRVWELRISDLQGESGSTDVRIPRAPDLRISESLAIQAMQVHGNAKVKQANQLKYQAMQLLPLPEIPETRTTHGPPAAKGSGPPRRPDSARVQMFSTRNPRRIG